MSRFADFSLARYEQEKREILRASVVRFARGNAALRAGDYVTREELDRRLAEMAADLNLAPPRPAP